LLGHERWNEAAGLGATQFWQPHHLLVLELNPRATIAEVLESKKRIEDLLG
jgi:hypothetical protein